jgi:hypothetical protein
MESQNEIKEETQLDLSRCQHIFKQGKNKGLQCTIKKTPFCSKHKSRETITVKQEQPKVVIEEEEEIEEIELPKFEIKPKTKPKPKSIPKQEIIKEEEGEEENEQDEEPITEEEYKSMKDNDTRERQIETYYRELSWLNEVLPLESRRDETSEEWLNLIYQKINTHGIDQLIQYGFGLSVLCAEAVAIDALKMKVKGVTQLINQNDKVKELLKVIRLQHEDIFCNIGPVPQLIGIIVGSFASMHLANSAVESKNTVEVKKEERSEIKEQTKVPQTWINS